MRRILPLLACFVVACGAAQTAGGTGQQTVKLITAGNERVLRKRPEGSPASSPDKPPILLIALDGIERSLLYGMIRAGELPEFARLLGPNTYFDETMLSTMPSTTMVAWTTAMTGLPPAEHGVMGNEYFVRESRTLACPAPVTFTDASPTISIFTDGYLDALHDGKTVYERMREKDPTMLAWVAMHFIYRGADKLLLTKKSVMTDAFEDFIEGAIEKELKGTKDDRKVYAALDNAVAGVVVDNLEKGTVPDVLTVYFSGADLFAHIAADGPDRARRDYLRDVVDPQIGRIAAKLRERNALDHRFVVVTADHGHTEVVRDEKHALGAKNNGAAVEVLKSAGFKVRPFRREVPDSDDFSAVVAYGGATAYVYLADRSTCGKRCDWTQPPRYEEDVGPVAEKFFADKKRIDLVLTRHPRPYAEIDAPFEVYVGDGKTMPVTDYLTRNAHPSYLMTDQRLHDLAVGKHGERAGDIMLIAANGDLASPEDRYYFAGLYRSWHGSPARQDSEIPFIVAHPSEPMAPIKEWIHTTLGDRPFQQKVTDVLLGLRESAWRTH